MERLHNTKMTHAKDLSALQHQDRSAERLPCVMENIQLRLVCQAIVRVSRCRVLGEVLDGVCDLGDIVFDQQLRARVCAIIQVRRGYIAEVADETAAKEVYEAEDIVIFLSFVDGGEALMDEAMVVVLAYGSLSPVDLLAAVHWDGPIQDRTKGLLTTCRSRAPRPAYTQQPPTPRTGAHRSQLRAADPAGSSAPTTRIISSTYQHYIRRHIN